MPALSRRDTVFTLIGILLALFLGALDQTIVSTALPRIVEDLQGVTRYAWVATAYLLASTVMVPIYGKLADMHSRKVIELWSIGLFLTGSVLCGLAGEFGTLPVLGDGMNQLIVFRALQGLGGAGLFAMAFIVIADLFPPAERGKYQGLVGGVFGIASVLGPLIGGFLTDQGGAIIPGIAGWRWVFYVNLPFGALALWFIITRMPSLVPHGEQKKLNYLSALLLIAGLVPLILGLQLDKRAHPWESPLTLALFAGAAGALTLFSFRSIQSDNPILDFSLFRNKVFSIANAALFLYGAAFLSVVIFLPLFMVNVVGVSATRAGVSLIPLSAGVVFGATVAGQLVSRFGHYRRFMLGGGVILFVGIFLLSRMTADVGYWQVTLYMVICGLGVGPTLPLYPLAIQNAVDVRKIGQATSAGQFFRQIGGAAGAALMGTVLAMGLVTAFQQNPALSGPQGNAPAASDRQFAEGGLENLDASIHHQFDQQYAAIVEAINSDNQAQIHQTVDASALPDSVKMSIEQAALQAPQNRRVVLRQLKHEIDVRADTIAGNAIEAMKAAFATAITRIFLYTLFLAAAAWCVTWFIPEVPLRKTFDAVPVEP